MKAIKLNKIVYLFIAGLLLWSCGEERVIQDYDVYNQVKLLDDDGTVSYDPVVTYPINGVIASEAAYFEMLGAYRFGIDEKIIPAGSTANVNNFSIDGSTGVIEYENSGELSPGTYFVSVRLENINGVAVYNQVYEMIVNEVPVSLQIDNEEVEAGIFEEGVIATLSYTDESGAEEITTVSYELINAPAGFSIDADSGDIIKISGASSGENKISVKATTNLGALVYEDILTVIVGAEPTILYMQQDGVTLLTKGTISPWTAYTTAAPILDGMTATSYEIVLPETLVAGSVTVDATGKISVAADQDLAIGDYLLGVIASNATGKSFEFNDVFVLTVDTRWETTPVFFEDFNNAIDPPEALNDYNASLNSYFLNSTSTFDFVAAYTSSKGVYTAKLAEGKVDGGFATPVDGAMVLELTMQADWRKMRVSFNEGFGYGDNRATWYERTLQSSHDITDLMSGTFDDSNWTTVMSDTDTDWSGLSVWKGLTSDADLNKVPFKDVVLTAGSDTVYLNWRVRKTGTATGGAAFLIDDISVEVSVAFLAEEE